MLVLAALAALMLVTASADARRRYYHRRSAGYSPPSSAMAIDVYSGRVLYAKNINEPRYPASLTKVMTLYLLFDALRDGKISMNTQIRVSAHAAAQSPTKLDLSEGDTISVADAIGAIVTKSANDMAVAVAEALAGSEEEFARRMTQKARSIGMLNTTFRNASGLPNAEQQTTAHDLIILGRSILADHPERCRVFATKYFQYDGEVFRNHNTLLFNYEGMDGMKTGFTSASGFNLIATAHRDGKRLLAVVLGGPSAGARNAMMRNILDNSWPKAMTQMAARKAGLVMAAARARRLEEPKVSKRGAEPQGAKPMRAAAEIRQAPAPAAKPRAAFIPVYSRLKRRPDQASISMLLQSIEAGLVTKSRTVSYTSPPESADTTTDEPEDRAEMDASRSPSYVPPPAQEIVRNETLAAMAAPAPQNVSVHYKTVRQPEVAPLAAAGIDPIGEPAPVKAVQPAQTAKAEEASPTLAEATPAEPERISEPGPFHIQVGAFSDEAQAKERLESVREALGPEALRAHPEFIMPVSLPQGVTMFRARLSRFRNEAQARAACRRLKKSGIECWGIPAE